jgi:hypothetical protein
VDPPDGAGGPPRLGPDARDPALTPEGTPSPTGLRIARIAGRLLSHAGRGSDAAVDALVVATTISLGGGMILTHDLDDLDYLAAGHPNVRVVAV